MHRIYICGALKELVLVYALLAKIDELCPTDKIVYRLDILNRFVNIFLK